MIGILILIHDKGFSMDKIKIKPLTKNPSHTEEIYLTF